jgi:SAM-dependent methyltransferase
MIEKVIIYLQKLLRENRKLVENDLLNGNRWQYFSPSIYSQYKVTIPLVLENARGRLLDLGCGNMPYRTVISKVVDQYDSLDINSEISNLTYNVSAEEMSIVPDNLFDTVISFEVLEHLPHPQIALKEIYRVLKPEGVLILTVPHLSRLHDIPHDYYRFTKYGLLILLKDSGYTSIKVYEKGGILCFLGHQLSLVMLCLFWKIPLVRYLIFFINKWIFTIGCYYLDKYLRTSTLFPLGYVAIARK